MCCCSYLTLRNFKLNSYNNNHCMLYKQIVGWKVRAAENCYFPADTANFIDKNSDRQLLIPDWVLKISFYWQINAIISEELSKYNTHRLSANINTITITNKKVSNHHQYYVYNPHLITSNLDHRPSLTFAKNSRQFCLIIYVILQTRKINNKMVAIT